MKVAFPFARPGLRPRALSSPHAQQVARTRRETPEIFGPAPTTVHLPPRVYARTRSDRKSTGCWSIRTSRSTATRERNRRGDVAYLFVGARRDDTTCSWSDRIPYPFRARPPPPPPRQNHRYRVRRRACPGVGRMRSRLWIKSPFPPVFLLFFSSHHFFDFYNIY